MVVRNVRSVIAKVVMSILAVVAMLMASTVMRAPQAYADSGTTSVRVTKVWDDDNNKDGGRPQSQQVQVFRAGAAVGMPVALSAANNWTHEFTDLPATDSSGQTIKYTIQEAPAEYRSVISGDQTSGFTITSTLLTTSVQVMTRWMDNNVTT